MHVLKHEGGWFEIWSEKQMFRSHYKDPPHFQIIWSIIERMAAVFARAPIAIKWCIWEISSENNKEAYGCYLLSHKIWAKSDHEQMCGSHFSKQTFH